MVASMAKIKRPGPAGLGAGPERICARNASISARLDLAGVIPCGVCVFLGGSGGVAIASK